MSELKDITEHLLKAGDVGVYEGEKYFISKEVFGCKGCHFAFTARFCYFKCKGIIFKKFKS